ncbi:MAG: hypothetical protein J6Y03_04915 [Alphaproteobacteria bacterium]|nr:hypothetical protein [Alphaproteobacteria bacterium]
MSEIVIEPVDEYDILLNEEGEVLIAIRARLGGVNRPQILYDGADRILMYRNADQTIYLANVPQEIRETLKRVSKLLMVEVHDEAIIREYMVPLKMVERLPAMTLSQKV